MSRIAVVALGLAVALAVAVAQAAGPQVSPPITISGPSPVRNCQDGQARDVVREAEVEPYLAIDPRNPRRLVAVYQQDRFRNGAARAIAASVSEDGGKSWREQVLPVGVCATHGPGPFRLSDPWVSIGGDSRIYALASAFVLTSADGGRSWSKPVELDHRTERYFLDKGSLTADPTKPGTAYAMWARYTAPREGPPVHGDAMLSVTRDGGHTWSAPRAILKGGPDSGPIASVILPDPDRGLLYHLAFFQIGPVPSMARPSSVVVQSSSDGGRSWSAPHTVAKALTVAEESKEAHTGTQIRTGFVVPAYAVDPRSGTLYVVWQDARFSRGRRYDQVVLARSSDRGRTWSRPIRVSAPDRQAFVPSVAVADDGAVGVTYFDTTAGRVGHPVATRYIFAASRDGSRSFDRTPVGPPFDLAHAPLMAAVPEEAVPPGLFLGDYMSLANLGNGFRAVYVTTNASRANPTDVRYAALRP